MVQFNLCSFIADYIIVTLRLSLAILACVCRKSSHTRKNAFTFSFDSLSLHFYRIFDSKSVRPSIHPSVRYVPVSDENNLTHRHSFFTVR